jgi:hypothetical protein
VEFRHFVQLIAIGLQARIPMHMTGFPGVGKTEFIKSLEAGFDRVGIKCAAAPRPITDDFLKLLEDSFARDWRKPRTWPWTRVAWAYGFALAGVTSGVGMSLLISALSASPPARAPAGVVEASQQFRVIQ